MLLAAVIEFRDRRLFLREGFRSDQVVMFRSYRYRDMNERECSDDDAGDGGLERGHDAEMCTCAIERAVSLPKKVSLYIFRSMNE